ncbi:MAG: envelope stress response membrane protein PspB [Gammaproteobacteria bacterium]|nr:envelope stress response membrane protein PspB [Gammaproteobacteria bacterium]
MSLTEAVFVPTILFMVIVLPTWIVFHYRAKSKSSEGLTASQQAELEDLVSAANKMAARIETLESILDVESPGWRDRQVDSDRL